jgi:uncharacterized protein (UPF0332 family)
MVDMMSQTEVTLYLKRAKLALAQSSDNLNLKYYDVAIARAYYAMFYSATALLLTKGISRSKHSGVYSAFGQHFIKSGLIESEYGRMLVNAFNIRLDSDYEVAPSLSRELAEDVLHDAERFVGRMASYLRDEGYL